MLVKPSLNYYASIFTFLLQFQCWADNAVAQMAFPTSVVSNQTLHGNSIFLLNSVWCKSISRQQICSERTAAKPCSLERFSQGLEEMVGACN